jgi:arginase family enzyme
MDTSIPFLKAPSVITSAPVSDEYEVRFTEILKDISYLADADAALVGVPFDGGTVGGRPGSRLAPKEIRASFPSSRTYEPHLDIDISDVLTVVDAGDITVVYTDVQATIERTRTAIAHLLRTPAVPVIMGGDHLIISSGTPFRLALERSGGKIRPENFVEIGPHGFHAQRVYREYIDKQGIRLITAQEVHTRGLGSVLEQAIAWATDRVEALYVSVDIDALDCAWAPGTGNPAPGGLTGTQILEAASTLGRHPLTCAFDVVEISPPLDVANLTVIMGREIIMNFLGGLALRTRDRL